MSRRTRSGKRAHSALLEINECESSSGSNSSNADKSASDELPMYLKLKNIEPKCDVFTWWYNNRNSFPYLYKLAKKYLIIPATSAASERVFSTAGYILNERRTRLKDDHLDMLIFLNNFLPDFYNLTV